MIANHHIPFLHGGLLLGVVAATLFGHTSVTASLTGAYFMLTLGSVSAVITASAITAVVALTSAVTYLVTIASLTYAERQVVFLVLKSWAAAALVYGIYNALHTHTLTKRRRRRRRGSKPHPILLAVEGTDVSAPSSPISTLIAKTPASPPPSPLTLEAGCSGKMERMKMVAKKHWRPAPRTPTRSSSLPLPPMSPMSSVMPCARLPVRQSTMPTLTTAPASAPTTPTKPSTPAPTAPPTVIPLDAPASVAISPPAAVLLSNAVAPVATQAAGDQHPPPLRAANIFGPNTVFMGMTLEQSVNFSGPLDSEQLDDEDAFATAAVMAWAEGDLGSEHPSQDRAMNSANAGMPSSWAISGAPLAQITLDGQRSIPQSAPTLADYPVMGKFHPPGHPFAHLNPRCASDLAPEPAGHHSALEPSSEAENHAAMAETLAEFGVAYDRSKYSSEFEHQTLGWAQVDTSARRPRGNPWDACAPVSQGQFWVGGFSSFGVESHPSSEKMLLNAVVYERFRTYYAKGEWNAEMDAKLNRLPKQYLEFGTRCIPMCFEIDLEEGKWDAEKVRKGLKAFNSELRVIIEAWAKKHPEKFAQRNFWGLLPPQIRNDIAALEEACMVFKMSAKKQHSSTKRKFQIKLEGTPQKPALCKHAYLRQSNHIRRETCPLGCVHRMDPRFEPGWGKWDSAYLESVDKSAEDAQEMMVIVKGGKERLTKIERVKRWLKAKVMAPEEFKKFELGRGQEEKDGSFEYLECVYGKSPRASNSTTHTSPTTAPPTDTAPAPVADVQEQPAVLSETVLPEQPAETATADPCPAVVDDVALESTSTSQSTSVNIDAIKKDEATVLVDTIESPSINNDEEVIKDTIEAVKALDNSEEAELKEEGKKAEEKKAEIEIVVTDTDSQLVLDSAPEATPIDKTLLSPVASEQQDADAFSKDDAPTSQLEEPAPTADLPTRAEALAQAQSELESFWSGSTSIPWDEMVDSDDEAEAEAGPASSPEPECEHEEIPAAVLVAKASPGVQRAPALPTVPELDDHEPQSEAESDSKESVVAVAVEDAVPSRLEAKSTPWDEMDDSSDEEVDAKETPLPKETLTFFPTFPEVRPVLPALAPEVEVEAEPEPEAERQPKRQQEANLETPVAALPIVEDGPNAEALPVISISTSTPTSPSTSPTEAVLKTPVSSSQYESKWVPWDEVVDSSNPDEEAERKAEAGPVVQLAAPEPTLEPESVVAEPAAAPESTPAPEPASEHEQKKKVDESVKKHKRGVKSVKASKGRVAVSVSLLFKRSVSHEKEDGPVLTMNDVHTQTLASPERVKHALPAKPPVECEHAAEVAAAAAALITAADGTLLLIRETITFFPQFAEVGPVLPTPAPTPSPAPSPTLSSTPSSTSYSTPTTPSSAHTEVSEASGASQLDEESKSVPWDEMEDSSDEEETDADAEAEALSEPSQPVVPQEPAASEKKANHKEAKEDEDAGWQIVAKRGTTGLRARISLNALNLPAKPVAAIKHSKAIAAATAREKRSSRQKAAPKAGPSGSSQPIVEALTVSTPVLAPTPSPTPALPVVALPTPAVLDAGAVAKAAETAKIEVKPVPAAGLQLHLKPEVKPVAPLEIQSGKVEKKKDMGVWTRELKLDGGKAVRQVETGTKGEAAKVEGSRAKAAVGVSRANLPAKPIAAIEHALALEKAASVTSPATTPAATPAVTRAATPSEPFPVLSPLAASTSAGPSSTAKSNSSASSTFLGKTTRVVIANKPRVSRDNHAVFHSGVLQFPAAPAKATLRPSASPSTLPSKAPKGSYASAVGVVGSGEAVVKPGEVKREEEVAVVDVFDKGQGWTKVQRKKVTVGRKKGRGVVNDRQ
ncbi:hypothetical protein IAT38_000098 [Cryptococcus sp. DSM 104549]